MKIYDSSVVRIFTGKSKKGNEFTSHDYYYRLLDNRLKYGILKVCDYVNVPVVAAVALWVALDYHQHRRDIRPPR